MGGNIIKVRVKKKLAWPAMNIPIPINAQILIKAFRVLILADGKQFSHTALGSEGHQ